MAFRHGRFDQGQFETQGTTPPPCGLLFEAPGATVCRDLELSLCDGAGEQREWEPKDREGADVCAPSRASGKDESQDRATCALNAARRIKRKLGKR
jgi:hypothetical protein